ncbi:PoNi-like cognate immunity protein [Cellvibrio sp. QJXJ]|uniref:PoNi-like cognate immunity protein n=1 Tax=Cellvibrio sp. QJXJ TaxID=2964606 RepID=UPI0021C3B96A|nr:PoNi-like cognate immunity protein [Cellvibrio sp. QJXJ]UUA71071.1 PoNi-like cognate immunity protein [Cellvibrio sp. QJXJ]
MLRDKMRNEEYFNEAIKFTDEYISEEIEYINTTNPLKPLAAMKTSAGLCQITLDRLEFCYSRGDKIEKSKNYLIDLLKYREMQLHYADLLPKEEEKHRVEWERLGFSTYKETFTWLAFAVSAGASQEYLKKLFYLVDNTGLDILFDRIAVKLGDTDRPIGTKVLYAKPYQLLLDALEAKKEQQPMLMNKFMDAWYPACVKNGFYDTHNITNNFGYAGYWCFEAALVTLVFKLDDSGYRNHKYYPAALVHGD